MAGIHNWDEDILPAPRAAAGAPIAGFDESDERELRESQRCPVTQALLRMNYDDLSKYQVMPIWLRDNADVIGTKNSELIYDVAHPLAKAYQRNLLGLKSAEPMDFYGKNMAQRISAWSPNAAAAIRKAATTPMNGATQRPPCESAPAVRVSARTRRHALYLRSLQPTRRRRTT